MTPEQPDPNAAERNAALRRRLKLLEAALTELTEEVSTHHAALAEQVTALAATVNRNHEIVSGKVSACQDAVKEIQLMVHGEPRYLMPGLAERIKRMDESVEALQDYQEALKNQVKGMSLALKVIGVGGGASVVAVLVELFG